VVDEYLIRRLFRDAKRSERPDPRKLWTPDYFGSNLERVRRRLALLHFVGIPGFIVAGILTIEVLT
jgi:hypothetical protein